MEEIRPDETETMRLYEAALRGCVATLNTLVQKDQLILCRVALTSFSETPLHISAMLGHLDFVKALLKQKPDLAAQLNSLKQSPLHLASAEGHTEIVKELLDANKDVCLVRDQDGRIPLHLATMRGRVKVIQELINTRPQSTEEVVEGGETVLHLCVKYNHLEALKLLVKQLNDGELLNSKNQDGNTILHMAVMYRQLETIIFLFSIPEVKARANTLNEIGFTALDIIEHSPRDFKSLEIRDILMEAGVRRAKTPSPRTNVGPNEAQTTKSRYSKWINYLKLLIKNLKFEGNWLHDTQGTFMLVATVIASMAFQAAVNPPGGVWQQTMHVNESACNTNSTEVRDYMRDQLKIENCEAGFAVLSYAYPDDYLEFMIYNCLSFIGSLIVVFFIISGFPLKNKICLWFMILFMCTTVTCMAFTFLKATYLLTPDFVLGYEFGFGIFRTLFYIWIGFLGVAVLFHTVRFVIWIKIEWPEFIRNAKSWVKKEFPMMEPKKKELPK